MPSLFKSLVAVVLITFSSLSIAEEYIAGKHYRVLDNPVAVMQDGKIHVEEAFWYGCPHCFHLEAAITPWKAALPADVAFQGVPAMFGRAWVAHAQLYYTADALGVLDQVHEKIFKAFHLKKVQLLKKEDQRDFLVQNTDVTAEQFDKAYGSFAVNSRMKRGDKRIRAFGLNGVPALVVNGKYVINGTMAGSQEAMLDVADYLIEKERSAN